MDALTSVELESAPCDVLAPLLDPAPFDGFERLMRAAGERLDGRTVWNINSTSEGGGVAEMLNALLPYAVGCGWDVRWLVMSAEDDFFEVTKGLHNALHGAAPADAIWDRADAVYRRTTEHASYELARHVRPGDLAIVHDPQAAGLIGPLTEAGVSVAWQCHIGTDESNDCTRMAWDLLRPYVLPAERYVFTREAYLWDGLDRERMRVIPPSIDALSPKNAPVDDVDGILAAAGIIEGRSDRHLRPVHRVGGTCPIPDRARLVVQVSRWDRLKDPIGFVRMFAGHLGDVSDLYAVYAGPEPDGVDDDPEARGVIAACAELWRSLHPDLRRRIHLLSIPMDDVDENATVVNALQRRADVVVQKSIKEGFGLTVAEAMWKSRPIVASAVGGIRDQITDGLDGLLIEDPCDLAAFGAAVEWLLSEPEDAARLGSNAHARATEEFLGDRHLEQYGRLFERLHS
jgi:trehalose synthase